MWIILASAVAIAVMGGTIYEMKWHNKASAVYTPEVNADKVAGGINMYLKGMTSYVSAKQRQGIDKCNTKISLSDVNSMTPYKITQTADYKGAYLCLDNQQGGSGISNFVLATWNTGINTNVDAKLIPNALQDYIASSMNTRDFNNQKQYADATSANYIFSVNGCTVDKVFNPLEASSEVKIRIQYLLNSLCQVTPFILEKYVYVVQVL